MILIIFWFSTADETSNFHIVVEKLSYFSFLTPVTLHRLNDLLLNKTIDSAIVKNKVLSSVLRGVNNILEKKTHDKSHMAAGSCISQQAISRAIWGKNNSHPTRKSPQSCLIITNLKVQLRLMGVTSVLQVFHHKPNFF